MEARLFAKFVEDGSKEKFIKYKPYLRLWQWMNVVIKL